MTLRTGLVANRGEFPPRLAFREGCRLRRLRKDVTSRTSHRFAIGSRLRVLVMRKRSKAELNG
jgi:hypothetical protein